LQDRAIVHNLALVEVCALGVLLFIKHFQTLKLRQNEINYEFWHNKG